MLFSIFPLSRELQMLVRNHPQLLTKSNPDFSQFLSSLNPSLNNDKKNSLEKASNHLSNDSKLPW
jgi:hypothetical protein